jgi:ketosteroid isomerase-like protein
MLKKILFIVTCSMSFLSCSTDDKRISDGKVREQVAKVEKDFAEMAAKNGIAKAFSFFADSNAVIKRGKDSLIKGKNAILNFYSADFYKTASVQWAPDFIDVSNDGTLAYTFGKYIWQSKDSTGTVNESRGVFHTVWKKQKDGSWKYVWD